MNEVKRVLVTGPGRSCSNWTMEIVRLSGVVQYWDDTDPETGHIYVEDRYVLEREEIPENYAAKCCTENVTLEPLKEKLTQYPDLKILFCTRHPVDLCMSKIVRGRSSLDGGDGSELAAPDSTVDGAISALFHANGIFQYLLKNYKNNVLQIKLEDLLNATVYETMLIASWIDAPVNEKMIYAYAFNRNKYHQERYKGIKDTGQFELYKRWDTVYDGFFADRKNDIDYITQKTEPLLSSWCYDKETKYHLQLKRMYA